MKCLTKLNNFLYIFIIRLCIFKLIIYNNNYVSSFKTSYPVVKHPGTCTYQQSQSACTFSLLCYLAGGIPVEGCGNDSTTTCCVLQNLPNAQQLLDYSKLANENLENLDKFNVFSRPKDNLPSSSSTVLPPSSSTTYADQLDLDQQKTKIIIDSLSASPKNPIENNQHPTESSLIVKNSNSNKYLNDDESNLHFSSSSLSASTNPFDSINGYQTHQIHHSPRSLYPPMSHPSSLQYHHRLQHIHSATSTNPHHLNHQKQHQQNLYLHQQRLSSHPFYHHSHSTYHSPSSPYNLPTAPPTIPSSNARSFHLQPNRFNNPHHLISENPQQNYYLKDLNDNLNYYSDPYLSNAAEQPPSSYNSGDHNFNLNDQNAYSSLGDISSPTSSISSSANVYNSPSPSHNNPTSNLNNEPDNNLPSPSAYDYSNPASSLLSTYSPTQTIDYKTYQKHTVNPNSYTTTNNNLNHQSSSDNLHFPPIYSTSSSTSSFESTTNHTNLYNSNKIYKKPDYTPSEPPISIKYYKNSNYEPAINYNTAANSNNQSPDDNPVNSEDETRLINGNLDNRLTTDEEEYNNNAIRRSRLAASTPLNSITLDKQIHGRNYIGEDICGKPLNKPNNRIIGGQDAYYGEFPFMVHIKIGKHQCGGALISSQYVITASHCVYQAPVEQLIIIMGVHDIESHNSKYYDEIPQRHAVESVHLHPNFRFSAAHPDRFDVALLKLKRPAIFTNSVRPVCLPSAGLKLEGWKAIVTGWGKTDSTILNRFGTRILQKVDVPIIKNSECEEWHQTRGIDLKIFPEMMCAGYEDGQKDACVGDSGGPLVIFVNGRYTLAGITSAGFSCATQRQPGIYHRIPYTVDWILDQINS